MNQLALPADDINSILKQIFSTFGADIAAAVKKNPEFLASIFKDALTQEIIKKDTLKGVFQKFQKGGLFGGLFGRGGLFSYLSQSLFKKSSTGLTAGVPLGKNLDPSNLTSPITPQTPLQPAVDKKESTSKEKQFLKGVGETEPIPILFAGFSGTGSQEITDIFSSLFKTLVKDILKGIDGIMPEAEEDYGERGLVGTALENLANLAMLAPFLRPFKLLKKATGFGKGGFFRNRKAARLKAARAARSGTPSIKPSTALKGAGKAATAGEAAALKGATKSIGAGAAGKSAVRGLEKGVTKSATKGLTKSLGRAGSRALPGLGTALTVGFLASDLASTAEREAKGEITQKEAYTEKGGAWGGAGGAMAGAAAGAAIGAMFGGVGAIPGAIIGGLLGGLGGQMGGEAIGSAMAPTDSEQMAVSPTSTPETPDIDIPEPPDYTKTLNDIVSNTGRTSDKITRLSDAIFALAGTFKTQPSNSAPSIVVNNQQNNLPSASQVAASNNDAIARIRQQFAV